MGRIFMEFDIRGFFFFFTKSVEKIQVWLKSEKSDEEPNDSMTIAPSLFLRIRNVSEKNVQKFKTQAPFMR